MKVLLYIFALSYSSWTVAYEVTGNITFEYRYFTSDALSTTQHDQVASVALQPEWFHQWDGGNQSLVFAPFVRWDQYDSKRRHVDIRELTWLMAAEDWEFRAGIRKVFWGVTESQHLVDIINQTDLVENLDGEDKLGQPMFNLSLIRDWGTVDLFVLPYFRERTFPGAEGRPRTSLIIDTDQASYQSTDKEHHIDYALRWQHTLGDWDVGLSHFYGTSRDPILNSGIDGSGNPVLVPFYELIHQTGIDVQATLNNWLWKLEVIRRKGQAGSYVAATGGLEYTFYGINDSSVDAGLVVEYLYDDRGSKATTPFQDDLMLGLRLTLNDVVSSEALIGIITDQDSDAKALSIEASRRFGNQVKFSVEARSYTDLPMDDLLYAYRNDDYIQVELGYYF